MSASTRGAAARADAVGGRFPGQRQGWRVERSPLCPPPKWSPSTRSRPFWPVCSSCYEHFQRTTRIKMFGLSGRSSSLESREGRRIKAIYF